MGTESPRGRAYFGLDLQPFVITSDYVGRGTVKYGLW